MTEYIHKYEQNEGSLCTIYISRLSFVKLNMHPSWKQIYMIARLDPAVVHGGTYTIQLYYRHMCDD